MDEKYIKQLVEIDESEVKLTDKKIQILVAAIEIFAKKGYAATSTSEIAKLAGVAEGTIFRHYESKKDLLLSIVKPGILKMVVPYFASQMVDDIFREEYSDMEDMLRAFIYNRLQFVRNNVALVKIILQEIAFHPEIKETFKEAFIAKIYPSISKTISQLQESEQLKEFPISSTVRFILSTILGFIVARFLVLPEADWNEEQEVEDMVSFIMDGIKNNKE